MDKKTHKNQKSENMSFWPNPTFLEDEIFVKLRQGSGKDRQGMALKAKGVKA